MQIVKESPKDGRGRKSKYPFSSLLVGDCLKIPADTVGAYRNISTAIYHFKKRRAVKWETTVRFDGKEVSVYRLK